jgi:hypothetical protein
MSAFRYAVTIEGIPVAFAEAGFPSSELSAWASVLEALHDLSEAETTLDLGARRMLGASFSFKMRDDTSNTLRSLVKPRQDPVAWLVESSIPATGTTVGTVEVSDTSNIPQPFYMGAETLSYSGTSGSDLTSVTRELYDSTAQKHYGNANDGSATEIFAAPRRWTGRKVTLWESERDAAGNWGAKTSIGVARLDDAPGFEGDDVWSFGSTNLAEWYGNRPLVSGLETVYPKDEVESNRLTTTVNLTADSVTKLWDGQSMDAARVIWTLDNGAQWVLPIESSTATSVTIDFDKLDVPRRAPLRQEAVGENGALLPVANTYTWTEAQPVLYWEGDPVDITLALLVSKLGDSTLGTWDVLPGLEEEEFGGISFQAGAGITQTDIDTDAFKALRGGPGWRIFLTDRMTVKDLLDEFCQATGSYWYVDNAGLLTVQRLTERLPPSDASANITDALWGVGSPDSIGTTESTVYHTVRWSGNWDPAAERHMVRLTVVDAKARKEAPNDDRTLELSTKFVAVDVGSYQLKDSSGYRPANPISRVDLETSLRRIQQYSKRPAAEIVVEVPVTAATKSVVPGVIVDVTSARIPDLEGATLETNLALCLGSQRNYDEGTFSLRLRLLDNGYLFAPAFEVTSVGGGGTTITLSTATPYGTATPTNQLAVGWAIEDTESTWDATVASIISTAVFTISGLTGTVSVGDIIVPKMDGTLSTATNADGYSMGDFCAMVSDTGASPANALTRWS